MVCKCNRSARE